MRSDPAIRPLSVNDLDEAGKMAFAHWGKEHPGLDPVLTRAVYQHLVRYYCCPASKFNSAAVAPDGQIEAFMLAHLPDDHANLSQAWLDAHLNEANRDILLDYLAYLDYNRQRELEAAIPGDLIAALFVSRKKGCGKILLDHLRKVCLQNGLTSIFLWTDDTCDCEYYPAHGFTLVGSFPARSYLGSGPLTTLLYRKNLKQS